MAIATPVSLGSNSAVSGSSIALSSSAYTTGDLIVVFVSTVSSSAITVSGVNDGSAFTKATAKNDGSHENVELWYRANVASSATPTITATLSGSLAGAAPAVVIAAVRVARAASSSPLDVAPAGQSSSTATPTLASGTLSQADEVIFGCNCNDVNGAAPPSPILTQASGFTNIYNVNNSSSLNGEAFTFDYKVVSSTSTVSYSPVWDTSGPCVTVVASFKGAPLAFNRGYVF